LGPLARLDLAEKLENQLQNQLQQGAKIIVGGARELQFSTHINRVFRFKLHSFQEETFGPLATVIRVKDENQAIAINNHRYGLAASIWTTDREHAYHLSRKNRSRKCFL
jgi:succinate-semialdehyde dehydrogenase/glutarate-semialdehyde dehydrogenase